MYKSSSKIAKLVKKGLDPKGETEYDFHAILRKAACFTTPVHPGKPYLTTIKSLLVIQRNWQKPTLTCAIFIPFTRSTLFEYCLLWRTMPLIPTIAQMRAGASCIVHLPCLFVHFQSTRIVSALSFYLCGSCSFLFAFMSGIRGNAALYRNFLWIKNWFRMPILEYWIRIWW